MAFYATHLKPLLEAYDALPFPNCSPSADEMALLDARLAIVCYIKPIYDRIMDPEHGGYMGDQDIVGAFTTWYALRGGW